MDRDRASVLWVRDLRRRYGRWRPLDAVRGVSFEVARGEIFGLIGPDGAGKTSIIQTLAGVLSLQSGRASVAGLDVRGRGEAVRHLVGYMPQGLGSNLYETLTVRENIEFFRDLRRLPAGEYAENRANLLAATRLEPFLDRRVAQLSGGMRQKLALICTLIHLPPVLLLDEPTTGVDPISRQEFWQIIRRVVEERATTVLLSTSYMDEAERCHRVALLHNGAIVATGTPETVRRAAKGRFAVISADPQTAAVSCLRQRADVRWTDVFGDALHIQFDGNLRDIETDLIERGVTIDSVAIQEPGLEDAFLQLLGSTDTAPAVCRFDRVASAGTGTSIECADVACRFGSFTAVNGVRLAIRHGEIFGLLGPNGAGKTTLIKMLCGLIEPTAGRISVGGVDVVRDRRRVWTAIGYMSQRFSLYPDLTVRQNLQLYASLYGIEPAMYADLADSLGLEPVMSRLSRDVPGGIRQRLSLLCAILHRPPIVFLDEPTAGVDPQARRVFWSLIYSLSRDAGMTVVVSTHYMDEAARCDRLGLMDAGKLIAVGSPSELKRVSERRSGCVLAIETDDLKAAQSIVVRRWPTASLYGRKLVVRSLDPDADRTRLVSMLTPAVGRVSVKRIPLSMDDTFIDFIEHAEQVDA
jgi:ABC-2 type transport system ATP-binding protein